MEVIKKQLILINCIVLLLFISKLSNGQTASAKLSKSDITIGDQIKLTLEFKGPADLNVVFPKFSDTITKNIEVVQSSDIKSTLSSDKKEKSFLQILTVTSFDSGYFAIPPIRFYYAQDKYTSKHYVESQALLLVALPVKIDVQKGIRDIKPPLEAKFTFREAIPYIIAFLIIAAITAFIIYYLKKKRKKEPIFKIPSKPKLPPHEIALAALEDLRNQKLWQNNKIKEFHSQLTEIIRAYIESRFEIPALEMVSDDIIDSFKRLDLDEKTKSELKEMLTLADLVKFAKESPLPSEHDSSFNKAIDFVKTTIITINQNNKKEVNN